MTFIRGQIPEAMTPEYQMKQQELREKQDPLGQLANSLMGGLSKGLEESIGEHYDDMRDTKTMKGADAILQAVGKDFDLQDILQKGQEMGAHPKAIKMAINLGKEATELKGKYKPKPGAQGKETSLMKSDVKRYEGYVETADKMRELNADTEALKGMLEGDEVGGAWTQFIEHVSGRDGIIGGLMGLYESGQTKEFNLYGKAFFQRFKQVLEGRLNETEFKFITNAIPSTKYTKEQNLQILQGYKAIADKYMFRGRLAEDIRGASSGEMLPSNFNLLMDKGMSQYENHVRQQMQQAKTAMKEAKSGAKVVFKYNGKRLKGTPEGVSNLIEDVGKDNVNIIKGGDLLKKAGKTKVVNGQTFVKMDIPNTGSRWIPKNAVEKTKKQIPGSKEA